MNNRRKYVVASIAYASAHYIFMYLVQVYCTTTPLGFSKGCVYFQLSALYHHGTSMIGIALIGSIIYAGLTKIGELVFNIPLVRALHTRFAWSIGGLRNTSYCYKWRKVIKND